MITSEKTYKQWLRLVQQKLSELNVILFPAHNSWRILWADSLSPAVAASTIAMLANSNNPNESI